MHGVDRALISQTQQQQVQQQQQQSKQLNPGGAAFNVPSDGFSV
jgi:hypothetical protein